FAVDNGLVIRAKLRLDLRIEFTDQTEAAYIMNVDLARVIGNTANITPSKEAPPPVVAKGKVLFQVPLATLGPSDPKDYPGKLLVPYKTFPLKLTGGKTYIIEMNK